MFKTPTPDTLLWIANWLSGVCCGFAVVMLIQSLSK